MLNFLKPIVVLIISILVFAGIFRLRDNQLLDFIQTRFYNPSIVNSYIKENTKDAELSQNFIFELQETFEKVLNEPAVRNSFLYNQSAEDIYERSRIFGLLIESINGLQSAQFVDANGIRIHFSTSFRDILTQDSIYTSYRNYTEDASALPFDAVSVPANGSPKFTMDEQGDRIIFSYPFYNSLDVYHGTALFSISIRALGERLISEGRIKVNENISVINTPAGILVGSPQSFKTEIQKKVSEIWNDGIKERITIDSEASGAKFSLISLKTDRGLFYGRLINDDLFNIPDSMNIILYFSMFATFYLALFFIVNFKPSPVTIVRSRIRSLRDVLFDQMYEDKSTQEKIRWLLELEQRRDEVRDELKYNLRLSKRQEKIINNIINKSWDETIAIIRASSGHAALALKIASLDAKELVQKAQETKAAEVKDVGELGEVEEIEEVESIDEAEEAGDVEEIEEAEAIEEVESIDEAVETADVEEIEEIEEIEEVESIDEAVETGDVEEIEEAEAIEEVEKVDIIRKAEEVSEPKDITDEAEFIFDVKLFDEEEDDDDGIEELKEIEEADVVEITDEFDEIPKEETEELKAADKAEIFDGFLEEAEFTQELDELTILADDTFELNKKPQDLYLQDSSFQDASFRTGSKGLLRLASEYETIEKADASKATSVEIAPKGLLRLASEYETLEKVEITPRGLLHLASEYVPAEEISEVYPSHSFGTKGLLARALAEIRSNTVMDFEARTVSGGKGLLALASEIEFSSSYPVISNEIDDIDQGSSQAEEIEEIINMDIVSPFVSMFSSLDDVKIEE